MNKKFVRKKKSGSFQFEKKIFEDRLIGRMYITLMHKAVLVSIQSMTLT